MDYISYLRKCYKSILESNFVTSFNFFLIKIPASVKIELKYLNTVFGSVFKFSAHEYNIACSAFVKFRQKFIRHSPFLTKKTLISVQQVHEVNAEYENCALLGCYTTSSGNSLPTLRNNLSPFSMVRNPRRLFESLYVTQSCLPIEVLEDGIDMLSRNVYKELPLLAA